MTTKKHVSFDAVQIREYPVVPSLNPAGEYGPAIEIGWEYRLASDVPSALPVETKTNGGRRETIELENGCAPISEYERVRPSSKRRDTKKFYLFANQRDYFVKTNNFTDVDIEAAKKEKESLFRQRERSNTFRSPLVFCKQGLEAKRRHKKVKRAVRNLKKNGEVDDANPEMIYSGWWLPLSAYLF